MVQGLDLSHQGQEPRLLVKYHTVTVMAGQHMTGICKFTACIAYSLDFTVATPLVTEWQ